MNTIMKYKQSQLEYHFGDYCFPRLTLIYIRRHHFSLKKTGKLQDTDKKRETLQDKMQIQTSEAQRLKVA